MNNQEKKQYSFNSRGKRMIILAYSKKQIAEYFRVSQNYLTNWCSKCGWDDDREIDLDLTKQTEVRNSSQS